MNNEKLMIYKQIAQAIRDARSILIASHEDPDGDSLGSQLAISRVMRKLEKSPIIVNQGRIPFKYQFLPDIADITDIKNFGGDDNFDLVMILECPDAERTGAVKNLIHNGVKIINIDHHHDSRPFGAINYLDDKASSVGEMLFELFAAENLPIDRETAILLYAAILTDTGRFRYNSTTKRTMEVAGRLIDMGVNPREITDKIYFALPQSTLRLTGEVLSGITFHENGRICLLRLDKKMIDNHKTDISEMDGLADYTLAAKDVIVGGLLKEINGGFTKVSLRSRDKIDVSHVAHKYGGGGHINAAGFGVNKPIDSIINKLLDDLKELVHGSV
jgi:phosphoesterase RecJ-like protein